MADMSKADLETLNSAIWKYGPKMQEIKAMEECSELQQALCKALFAWEMGSMDDFLDAVDHVFEEVADVEIMLAQIRLIFSDAPSRIDEWKARKLERLRHRLDAPRED